jgi:lysophospholipase L1-like esterase
MRDALASTLLLVASTLLALGAAETVARVTYREPWYERLIGEQLNTGIRYRLNSAKLRDDEISDPKPAGERRLLILGDSFTFGEGVPDDDAIFPNLLEHRLDDDARAHGIGTVDVLNGGIPGSLTSDWIALWDRVSERYRPDALLVVFFLRDGTRTASIPEFFGKIRDEILNRNHHSVMYTHSYLYRVLRDRMDRRSVGDRYTRTFLDSYFGSEADTAEWRLAQRNLLRLRDRARERSLPMGLVVFPILVELGPNYPFQAICREIAEFARSNGIPVHDLLPAFLGQDGPALWVSAFNQHPNARGHRIAADAMYPFVRGLLEPAGGS